MYTAQDLVNEIQAATKDQFGDDIQSEVFPTKFFRDVPDAIYTYKGDPNGPTKTQRAPRYCATDYAAERLSIVLGASATVRGNAMHYTAPPDPPDPSFNPAALNDGWVDTDTVPYLEFTKDGQTSTPINAGLLLDYFNHVYPAAKALADAQNEIAGAF